MYGYIDWCKQAGMTQLDPWNRHLSSRQELFANLYNPWDQRMAEGGDDDDNEFLESVKDAADRAGIPFGCIAVDGAHIFASTAEERSINRAAAHKWIAVARKLGARQVRVDAGGPDELPERILAIIVEGYRELIEYASQQNVQVLMENHWGPTKYPTNVIRILESVDGLGFLFDTNNWMPELQQDAWAMCAPYATLSHIKTFRFDAQGNDPSVDVAKAVELLLDAGFAGVWGIESCPEEIDEREGAAKTLHRIQRLLRGRPTADRGDHEDRHAER